MEVASFITLSGMTALRREMDIIANNLANINTTGYKKQSPHFIEYLTPGDNKETTSYVQDYGMIYNFENGPLQETQNTFDLAIEGEGYFEIQTENGPRYTRNGRFTLNETGQLVTSNGDPLVSNGAAITINDASNVRIAQDGTVSTKDGIIGRITVQQFENPQELVLEGNSLLRADNLASEPAQNTKIIQGFLEGSNVESVQEITRMIQVSRSYQSMSRFLETEHQRQQNAIRNLVKTQ